MGVGTITLHNNDTANFNVYSIKELQVIIDHCVKYPLITQKHSDFLLFKQAFEIIQRGDHLTEKGLLEIVGLKSALNLGLSEKLRAAFLNFVSITRPAFKFNGIPDPFWISGFVSGDSTFCVSIEKSINQIGRVRLIFGTCLHIRDKALLIGIANYFNLLEVSKQSAVESNSKYIYDSTKRETSLLQIRNYSDIVNKIIPFFNEYPILGVKRLDFV